MKSKQREINGYVLMDTIGKGSYAEVFKCKKKSTGEIFAMKIFKQLKQCGPQKIKKEVQIVQKLTHPNIIRCYDYFVQNQDQTKLYAVFQYCQKGTLKDLTQQQMYTKNRFSESEAKTYIRKILDALIYLHENKIAHRDLKLDNILINGQLDIKLADFGLSKSFQEGNVLDTFCGTPLTMAPEILGKQESYSEKCDTWSFGVISYFLIYLDYPFYSPRMAELKRIIEKNEVKFPSDVQISQQGKDFLKRCLTVDPFNRPSVEELKFHPWFSSVLSSKIRVNFMKQSLGESSQHVQKCKNQIKKAIKTQIDKIIICTNLFPTRIEEITKGFEQFYPKQKMNLFLFMLFAFNKLQQLRMKGFITLDINDHQQQIRIENRNILKLSKHLNHILQMLQGRMKSLVKSIGVIDGQQCARSYQILIKFFANQSTKFIEQNQPVDNKKLRFFIYLFNFLNTILLESTVEMKLKKNNFQQQMMEDINLFVQNILSVEKILKGVNSDENSIDLESNNENEEEEGWMIQYRNRMKVAEDDETWSLVGETIERALIVLQLANSDNSL